VATPSHLIPSTHTGSLPRPDDLIQIMWAVGDGIPVDKKALDERVQKAIQEVVDKQVKAGVTIINDGEMSKPSYATYVKDRLSGLLANPFRTISSTTLLISPAVQKPWQVTLDGASVPHLLAPAQLKSSTAKPP